MSKPNDDLNTNPAPSPEPLPNPEPTLDLNAIHAQIEKARMEERTKVREELTNLSNLNKSFSEKVTKLETENRELSGKLSALEKAQGANGEVDVSKLISEVAAQTEAKMASVISELKSQVTDLGSKSRLASLEVYRRDAIAKAGGEAQLITALVTGNSEEEIDASISVAKDEYQKVVSRVSSSNLPPLTQKNGNGIGANVPPSLSVLEGRSVNTVQQPSIRELSTKEWAAKRESVLANLRKGQSA